MKQIADWALGMAVALGASHAEARIVDERARSLGTRNGRVAVASDGESLGLGVRVLTDGGWGFAATQELTRKGVECCAGLAVEIARASARVRREPVRLVDEPAAVAEWSSPCQIDPFAVSVEENFELLRKIERRDSGGGRDAGGDQHDLPALRAMVLQLGGRGDPPDARYHGRGVFGACLRG